MATYILLLTLTPEGREQMLNDAESLLRAEAAVSVSGVQLLGLYGVLGDYDFVSIVEAPDNDAVARFSLEFGVRSLVADPSRRQIGGDDTKRRRIKHFLTTQVISVTVIASDRRGEVCTSRNLCRVIRDIQGHVRQFVGLADFRASDHVHRKSCDEKKHNQPAENAGDPLKGAFHVDMGEMEPVHIDTTQPTNKEGPALRWQTP